MKMIIVTGMSGAGKSTALNVLEDEGYYCVDNMPISLIPKFAELANAGEDGYSNIAIGVDIRSGHALAELDSVLDDMLNKHFNYTILFLESSDDVLVKRYKETPSARLGAGGVFVRYFHCFYFVRYCPGIFPAGRHCLHHSPQRNRNAFRTVFPPVREFLRLRRRCE